MGGAYKGSNSRGFKYVVFPDLSLPFQISKILEKIFSKRLFSFLSTNNSIIVSQYGFKLLTRESRCN